MANRNIDLMYELGTLRHLPRAWRQFGGLDFANVAEHSFRVAWLSILLATEEGADPGRAALLALMHDVSETRTGDRNYVQREHSTPDATLAVTGTFRGTTLDHFALSLWEEWNDASTLEALVARDADVLDCDLELAERAATGATLPTALIPTRTAASLGLRTESARTLWHEILSSDVHTWHLDARNRLNTGDWSSP